MPPRLPPPPQRRQGSLRRYRQLRYWPAADGVGYGVGDSRRDRRIAAFANAFALERRRAAGRFC